MSDYLPDQRRLTLKLVYYGPALSGKTTNLMQLHSLLRPQRKGELMVLETRDDRTLFFDLLPVGLRSAKGFDLRLKLYTVPGQVQHDSTRKAVLSRADAVVFVADSVVAQQENNAIAFDNLADNLQKLGMDIEKIPLVLQFNKRDAKSVVPEEDIRTRWHATPWADVAMASAINGAGVVETLQRLLAKLYAQVDAEYGLARDEGIDERAFVNGLTRQEGSEDAPSGR